MEAVDPKKKLRTTPSAAAGELVLQNGRQAGARRPLTAPTTCIGRNAGCEVRLNVDGVDPLHCLLAFGPTGVHVRDLDSIHGTHVNGERIDNAILNHGDTLKIGPFQFRLELTATPLPVVDDTPIEEYRESLRIQAAAVAAQQIALEEEEARLQQRRSDLQQQEEQLAAHLAEKQRQVELWSDHAKTERENLRKEKIEQEKRLSRLEQELTQAQQEAGKEQQKLMAERQRIDRVYQRLRQRWQKHWSAEKEKHQKHARKLQEESLHLEEAKASLLQREEQHKQDVLRSRAEHERALRQQQDGHATLARAQERWRRRRSLEHAALKAKEHGFNETRLKIKQAHQLLLQEKHAWDRQLDFLQKELHGLNNRILHQRNCVQERTDEIARLDQTLRERKAGALHGVATDLAVGATENAVPECEVVVLTDDAAVADTGDWQRRFDGLDRLAGDLADQRVHLIEQYRRLADIQNRWQLERDYTAAELETLARRLVDQEHTLAGRAQHADAVETLLRQRQEEIEVIRQEIQIWRAQLRARELIFEEDQQKQLLDLRQKETLLHEQSAAITTLREHWNRQRQQEVEQLRTQRAALEEQHKEINEKRLAMFENGQEVAKEKRILAEKALSLEQYRQETFLRANDPTAERRVERLRRRWLTLNAELIRHAKNEGIAVRKELAVLEAERVALTQLSDQVASNETAAAEKQTQLEEQEILLKGRQAQLEQMLASLHGQRQPSPEQHLRIQQNEADAPALDNAA
jgi:pSer/pThr/pTyr-binding forkhead associated (FHA) protein